MKKAASMTGRVSAIVSAYYAEPYLKGRIENLLDQDEHPEIIAICRNGSVEHKILEDNEWADRITYILTDDTPSVYQAWNIGIKAASRKYVTNANCDDRLYAGALKSMADILDQESTYGVVYSDIHIVTEIGKEPEGVFKWMEGGLKELLTGCFLGPMPMWRKSLHDRFGYFDEFYKSAGDYEYWMRLASNGVKFYKIRGAVVGAYLKRQNSVEAREPLLSLWEANHARLKYREVANA